MEKNLHKTKPRYNEHILPVLWPFIMWRFHCSPILPGLVATPTGFLFDGPVNFCGKMNESLGNIYLCFRESLERHAKLIMKLKPCKNKVTLVQ